MNAAANELRYQGVLLSADVVAEERGGRSVVAIPRESIRRIELARGPAGERLALQVLFAMLLIGIGVALLVTFIAECLDDIALIHGYFAFGPVVIPLAAFFLWLAFCSRFYLLVRTRKEVRKVGFEARAKADEVATFLELAQRVHGYEIDALRVTKTPFR